MKIEVKIAHLHTPLFLAKFNLGLKLDTDIKKDLRLIWDREDKELIAYLHGQVAIVPTSNVASVVPMRPSDIEDAPPAVTRKEESPIVPVKNKIKAQVSTPQSHVFAGEKQ